MSKFWSSILVEAYRLGLRNQRDFDFNPGRNFDKDSVQKILKFFVNVWKSKCKIVIILLENVKVLKKVYRCKRVGRSTLYDKTIPIRRADNHTKCFIRIKLNFKFHCKPL